MNSALKKIIFGILAIVIVIELAWAYQTLNPQKTTVKKTTQEGVVPPPKKEAAVIPVDAVRLSLLPAKVSFGTGQITNIDIVLNAGTKKISTADIDLKYDPNVLQIIKTTPATKIFNKTLTNKNDEKTGRVNLSLTQTTGSVPVTGKNVIATVSIQALKPGLSDLSFTFNGYGETNDSNVLETGKTNDIL